MLDIFLLLTILLGILAVICAIIEPFLKLNELPKRNGNEKPKTKNQKQIPSHRKRTSTHKRKKSVLFWCKAILSTSAVATALFSILTCTMPGTIRINPHTDGGVVSIDNNSSIELYCDYSTFFKIYYTTNGKHVADDDDRIKYSNPINVANIKTDDEFTIHAALRIFDFYIFSSSQTYTITENDKRDQEVPLKEVTTGEKSTESISFYPTLRKGVEISIPEGAYIVVKSTSGHFLSVNNDKMYCANKDEDDIDEACVIRIKKTPDNYTAFFNMKSKTYATAEIESDPCLLSSKAYEVKSWECFKLYKNDIYVRISSQGKVYIHDPREYLTCEEEENQRPISIRCEVPKLWENFSVYMYEGEKTWRNILVTDDIIKTSFDVQDINSEN